MPKLTYMDETGRVHFTTEGAQLYCSSQAMADMIYEMEKENEIKESEQKREATLVNDVSILLGEIRNTIEAYHEKDDFLFCQLAFDVCTVGSNILPAVLRKLETREEQ